MVVFTYGKKLSAEKLAARNQMAVQAEFIIDNHFDISSKEKEDIYKREIEYDGWYWQGHKSYAVLGDRPEICLQRCNMPMTKTRFVQSPSRPNEYKRGTKVVEKVFIYLANEDGTCSDKRPEWNVSISPSGKWSVGEFRRTIW